jgi:cytochrome bd-type quinol oxidase subunit 2
MSDDMTSHDPAKGRASRLTRFTGWFLALCYGVGAPIGAILELGGHVFSQRFDFPPALILVVCGVQLACAAVILLPRFAPWAAAALTVTTVGAIGAHLRIGSPVTALPAIFFTVLQVWYGIASRRR